MTVELHVPQRSPLNIGGSLQLFRRSGDDFIDRWDGEELVRALYVDGGERTWVPFVARATGGLDLPAFSVVVEQSSYLEDVRRAVAGTFVEAPADFARLLDEDPVIAGLNSRFPGIRQIRQLDVFTALIRGISAQQVNLRWAVTTRRRLAERFGRRYLVDGRVVYALDPERIAGVDPVDIRALQFTTSKSLSIVATAQAIVDDPSLSVDGLSRMQDEEVVQRLVQIRGIGPWSAEWVLARTLARPRVVAGDLGVRKAVGLAYGAAGVPSEIEVRAMTAHWGESAGVAQALLLYALGEGALTPLPARTGSRAASRA